MTFDWESNEDRLRRHMKMTPKEKLKWLEQIKRFTQKYSTKTGRKIKERLAREQE